MLNKKALSATAGAPKVFVEDVFSCFLYTGNGSTQTITNNIDLSTEGGLVWNKARDNTSGYYHALYDTVRGTAQYLSTNTTGAQVNLTGVGSSGAVTAFNTNGFTFGSGGGYGNANNSPSVTWTFRKAKKFFDVVTYTGDGNAGKTISHNLGSTPGCIIVKRTDTTGDWYVYHRSNTAAPETDYLLLNSTDATADLDTVWNDTAPTSTVFSVGTNSGVNANSGTYVAYLFAHDAGGFGDAGSDSIIKCGSVVGASQVEVSLGWEPQWLLVKNASASQDWWVVDNMRGLPVQDTSSAYNASALRPNLSDAETTGFSIAPSATGFKANVLTSSQTYIYIAIRRGPMKTPTSGTSVFAPALGVSTTPNMVAGFPVDSFLGGDRDTPTSTNWKWWDRLRGNVASLLTTATAAEDTSEYNYGQFQSMTGFISGNYDASDKIGWLFRRAPGFFDVVCYTGTGSSGLNVTHNLGVVPELIIIKERDDAVSWRVYSSSLGNTKYLTLNSTSEALTSSTIWNDTTPTSTVFTLGNATSVNSAGTYVAYLFASVSGVSKVGSYTGNGSSVTVTTDFQPRFILVKRTDSTGNWIVGDSARGLVSADEPALFLNTTAAETTGQDWVDVSSTGFTVNETALNANVNTATYIYLAVA